MRRRRQARRSIYGAAGPFGTYQRAADADGYLQAERVFKTLADGVAGVLGERPVARPYGPPGGALARGKGYQSVIGDCDSDCAVPRR
jgi:hypothetical protein